MRFESCPRTIETTEARRVSNLNFGSRSDIFSIFNSVIEQLANFRRPSEIAVASAKHLLESSTRNRTRMKHLSLVSVLALDCPLSQADLVNSKERSRLLAGCLEILSSLFGYDAGRRSP